eukprot:comp143727_c0_seq1/m.49262 comp143727_c0_seq1/g.49262  ORF comp143727_c0_seq1/g.49262 comp143727_c0_seq1/m.49262 type:complete len:204 (-) comp143727_c0_seq1:300-911(-)
MDLTVGARPSLLGPEIDYNTTQAIPHQQLVNAVNAFTMHTVGFINRFASVCETKLADVSYRIQRLETYMQLLETKLDSIPGIAEVTATGPTQETNTQAQKQADQQVPLPPPISSVTATETTLSGGQIKGTEADEGSTQDLASASTMTVSQDARFTKYFKMLRVGVPVQQIKMKMQSDGVDPDIIDMPDAPAPPIEGEVVADDM